MLHIGGKNAKKKTTSKRHFTVVMGNKEHGLYVSSSPSSAARKAVSKLCATNKKRKVQFSIREITQGSKKKTYGPYLGAIEKLKEPIELKGRVIRYKPVAKLSGKTGAKKRRIMRGGESEPLVMITYSSEMDGSNSNHRLMIDLIVQLREIDDDIFNILFYEEEFNGKNKINIHLNINFNNFSDINQENEKYTSKLKEIILVLKNMKKMNKRMSSSAYHVSHQYKFGFHLYSPDDKYSPEYNKFLEGFNSEFKENNS